MGISKIAGVLVFILSVAQCQSQLVHSFCSTSKIGIVPGTCRPIIKCISLFQNLRRLETQTCRLPSGEVGVCCPDFILAEINRQTGSPSKSSPRLLESPPEPSVVLPMIRPEDIDLASCGAEKKAIEREMINENLRKSGFSVESKSSTARHRRLQQSSARALKLSNHAAKLVDTSTNLVDTFGLSPDQGKFGLAKLDLQGTSVMTSSEKISRCKLGEKKQKVQDCRKLPQKFRTLDGSCNNDVHPHWGEANTALLRLLPPDYEDGVSSPRGTAGNTSLLFSTLPSPRLVSTTLISGDDRPSQDFTLLLMQWGQFMDHDITFTPINKGQVSTSAGTEDSFDAESEILCCTSDGKFLPVELRHDECFPVDIPSNDPFHERNARRCMEFVRSMPAERPECNLGPREQVNQITAYIDASNVYGSELPESRKLRLGKGGRMRVSKFRKEELLPLNPKECADHDKNQYCFTAGDKRCNEQPQLALMHTVWLREHNRLAVQLSLLNSHWDDERIFQEARKLVGAQLQHITYNEWLPIILGNDYMTQNHMKPVSQGYTKKYNPNVNPSVSNVFATAAFRFGHSLVQSFMDEYDRIGSRRKRLQLHQHQFAPFELYDNEGVDGFIRGLSTQPSQQLDSKFSKELTDRLFQSQSQDDGMDLVALNLQRGRDHGLAPYIKWRRLCRLPEITSWRDLSKIVSAPELIPRMQQLYKSVDEIDLYIGGILEKSVPGALLGPTFQCIVGDQFQRLRLGDRFFYEEGDHAGAFTPAQLEAIRSTSLARVLCDNANNLESMQPLAFKTPGGMNSKVGCLSNSIPRVDLSAWKENPNSGNFVR